MATRRFTVEAVFKAINKVTAPVSRMGAAINRMTGRASKGIGAVNKKLKTMGAGFRSGALGVAAAASIVGVGLGGVVRTGAQFEQAITNVGAVALKSRADISMLEDQARSLGRTTKFTATEAANAMEILMRAGFGMQGTAEATPGILGAAAASGLEIAETADIVASALKGMKLPFSDATHVADVLTLASARTNSTMGSLGEALALAAPTMSQYGVAMEDAVGAIALMQDVGLSASISGTALNTAFTKMAKPTDRMREVMDRLNITFDDGTGNMKSFTAVMAELVKMSDSAGGNLGATALFAELVGLRGDKAAKILSDMHKRGRLAELTFLLKNANGEAAKMAGLRMDTLFGDFLLLKAAVDEVTIAIADMATGDLRGKVQEATAWVLENRAELAERIGGALSSVISKLPELKTAIQEIARIGGFVVPAFLAFKGISSLVGLTGGLMAVGMSGPFAGLVAGALAAALAFGVLAAKMGSVREAWDEVKHFLGGPNRKAMEHLREMSFDRRADRTRDMAERGGFYWSRAGITSPFERQGPPGDPGIPLYHGERTPSPQVLLIRDETGRAELEGDRPAPGVNIILEPSGSF